MDDDDLQGEQLQCDRLLTVADNVETTALDTDVVDLLATTSAVMATTMENTSASV